MVELRKHNPENPRLYGYAESFPARPSHGDGGLVAPSDLDKLSVAITELNIRQVLFANRIRFDTPAGNITAALWSPVIVAGTGFLIRVVCALLDSD